MKPPIVPRNGGVDRARTDGEHQVSIRGLTKTFGELTAVDDLSLEVRKGEFLVLLGPSGCGKTTTMRGIVGLEAPDRGRITLGAETVFDADAQIDVAVHKRNVGMVFQSYAIWPHRTVRENVEFPLKMRKVSRKARTRQVDAILELFGLGELAERGASMLSGGQMQRVALARSVVMEPEVLLLDEPLSNLDAKLRERLRLEIRRTQQDLGITAVHVTHDQSEALAVADRIAVMRDGRIEQLASPKELYTNPVNRFVADFIGNNNLLPVAGVQPGGQGGPARVRLSNDELVDATMRADPTRAELFAFIRPEDVMIADGETPGMAGQISLAMFMGDHAEYEIQLSGGLELRAIEYGPTMRWDRGQSVYVTFAPGSVAILADD